MTKTPGAGQLVDRLIAEGQFTYTNWFMLPEPMRSAGLMYIDGIKDRRAIEMPRVLLVGIFGYDVSPLIKGIKTDMGRWAMVSDAYPERLARMHIYRFGWGHMDRKAPEVVEWRWILKEAESAEGDPAARGLYKGIMKRHGADPAFLIAANAHLETVPE